MIIIIGGAREVLCQDHDHIDLILLKRKGFIKKGINKCLNPEHRKNKKMATLAKFCYFEKSGKTVLLKPHFLRHLLIALIKH